MATASSLAGAGRDNAYDSIAASATDSVLVAAVTGKKIRVLTFIINQGDTTPRASVQLEGRGRGDRDLPGDQVRRERRDQPAAARRRLVRDERQRGPDGHDGRRVDVRCRRRLHAGERVDVPAVHHGRDGVRERERRRHAR
jgi:hypothetical protein